MKLSDTQKFNLADPAFLRDPTAMLAEMRELGPLVPIKIPLLGKIWVTTTYAATEAVMKGKDDFFLEARNAGGRGGAAMPWFMPPSLRIIAENMLAKDEPHHKRLRKLVDIAFRRHGVQDMRPRIETRARALLDDLGTGPVDLVPGFCRRLPLLVICDLLGLQAAEGDAFADKAAVFGDTGSGWQMAKLLWSMGGLTRLVRQIIANARADRRPGLLTQLIEAEEDGDHLSERELVAMVFLMLFAGKETTTNLIAGSVWALEQHPEQRHWLLADFPTRREPAVEELLRFVSSISGTKPRFAGQDVRIEGQLIRQRERVMALPIAANHDPARFDAPHELRLDRFPNPHLSFSSGIHFCLGLQLARVETQAALQVLYQRYPRLVANPPTYLARAGHRAVKSLIVTL